MLKFLLTACIIGFVSAASVLDGQRSAANGQHLSSLSKGCQIEGRDYPSETIVPREHPCHYCVCHEGKVTCYWKNCARAPSGCKVMDFQNTCNPSLYICGIPESVRNSPNRQELVAAKAALPATTSRPSVITQTTESTRLTKAIEPPSRHLTPPDPPSPSRGSERQSRVEIKQPSEFSLKTKHKMRFTRSVDYYSAEARLPFGIEEAFPIDLKRELPAALVESIRQKRAILGFPEFHHHHHDHPDEESLDRGCLILGVRYDVGDVIGIATDVCQECRCAAQTLFCSPKCCFNPAPLGRLTGEEINNLIETTSATTRYRTAPHPLHSIIP